MKIAICVDYKSDKFNKDFAMSNAVLGNGHNVFLVTCISQLQFYMDKCDLFIEGVSSNLLTTKNVLIYKKVLYFKDYTNIDMLIEEIKKHS